MGTDEHDDDERQGYEPVLPDAPESPADAFELLGHEIRLATIEALAEQRREAWIPRGLRFSELREAVGVRDTGKFNYHLDQLRGSFVTKFGEEYVLTNAGFELAGALRAGTFDQTDTHAERRAELDRTCPLCDEELTAVYEYGYLRIECPNHGEILATTLPPAAVRGRDMETIVELANVRTRDQVDRIRAGGCPHCWGEGRVTAPSQPSEEYIRAVVGEEPDSFDSDAVLAECACEDCGMRFWLPVSVCVAFHPAVVAYYHEHGVTTGTDYLDVPHTTGSNGTVVAEEPVRIEVDVVVDGAEEALVLTLDGHTEVVDYRREPAASR